MAVEVANDLSDVDRPRIGAVNKRTLDRGPQSGDR
jgi:hypothetical protein